MVDAPAEQRTSLHIITHLDWEREGQHTFDAQRALLLDILAQLLDHMQGEDEAQLTSCLLGGQTVILEDIAQVRPDLLTSLITLNTSGRLGLGPWYVHIDGLLAEGEALVRNLLLGQVDSKRHGIQLQPVAYLPDICQHTAQLPQILRGFQIDSAFMCLGQPSMPLPFRWQAPDGSSILVVNYHQMNDPGESLRNQQDGQPDGPFIWMHRIYRPQGLIPANLETQIDIPTQQSTLQDYVAGLREKLPDNLRPTLNGEIHLQPQTSISGRFSARLDQKQANARLQTELTRFAEPLLALAEVFGDIQYPQNQRALLEYSWRLLLQNQARYPMAGAIGDAVQDAMTIRDRRIADNTQRVLEAALQSLPGIPTHPRRNAHTTSTETFLVVWNPHGQAVEQAVELPLTLPTGLYPGVLVAPSGDDIPFSWNAETQVLGFRADAPPVGYMTYTLQLSEEKTAAYNQQRIVAGRAIGSASGESLSLNSGRLDWTFNSTHLTDLLSFYDGGDAGDIWQYAKPEPDIVMRGSIVDVVQVEATPTYERLIFRNRMRVAPGLTDGKSRSRGLKVLDIMTTATYYYDLPGVYFHTSFNNSAHDHRLRAHIRTGINAQVVYTDAAFGIMRRTLPTDQPTGLLPIHSVAALYDYTHGFALFTRGLPEIEPIREDNQITLGLTLLRAVGWLDKRQKIQAPSAQLQGDLEAEFMLLPLDAKHNQAHLLQVSQTYRAPLRAVQYDEMPPQARHSYLELDNEGVVITALKPPQMGSGLVLHLLNPSARDIGVNLKPAGQLRKASQLNLAEEHQADYPVENGRVNVTLEPHQVVTIRLEFEA